MLLFGAMVFRPAVRADDAAGVKLRLQAHFAAKDDAARQSAPHALADQPAPAELDKRAKLVRDALARPARKGLTRTAGNDAFVVTPRGYDEKARYATLVSLHGHGNSAHLDALR